MSTDPSTAQVESRPADSSPSFLLNALIGAVVTIVTAPLLPLAAIVGGGVAGYLQRGDLGTGAKVGAVSGLIAAVPAVFFAWLVASLFLLGGDLLFGLTSIVIVVGFLVLLGYLVGAGALGGALGAYLRAEM